MSLREHGAAIGFMAAPSKTRRRAAARNVLSLLGLLIAIFPLGCRSESNATRTVTLWHQMSPAERETLNEAVDRFERDNPQVRVNVLYKETEELRSGFQAAALAGTGPDLIYGPSDAVGTFAPMGIIQDLGPYYSDNELRLYSGDALTYATTPESKETSSLLQIGDRIGNHLALIVNRNIVNEIPRNSDDLIRIAKQHTRMRRMNKEVKPGFLIWVLLGLVFIIACGLLWSQRGNIGKFVGDSRVNLLAFLIVGLAAFVLTITIVFQFLNNRRDDGVNQYGLVFNFIEPYFAIPFITGHGGWIFDDTVESIQPALDTPEVVDALVFVRDLQEKHNVLPAGCDYEMADTLFKTGQAAMIINGDWSWGDYLANPKLDAAVIPLPTIVSTGLSMAPMVAPRGYSLNINSHGQSRDDAIALMKHLLSKDVQQKNLTKLKALPSLLSLSVESSKLADPTLRAAATQREQGRMMPTYAELRGVWEAMRPHYQALLGGDTTPQEAATLMQADAVRNIRRMNEELKPGIIVYGLQGFAFLFACGFLWWQRGNIKRFFGDIKTNPLAYLLVAPAMLVLVITIVYPFLYNIALSFSNMSLRQFRNWQLIGLQNYGEVLTEPAFFVILLKTIIWTLVCVVMSVAIGLLLAVALNGNVRGKAIYQVTLILPWAIPAYITALTWRGMFDAEFGAINLIGNGVLGLPTVNWLGEPTAAFTACIITNVWLGFPFMMVIALGGMQGIPRDLYEAARIDRVSRWGQFRHITLPMLRPVLAPAITLGTIWTFNNINVVWLVSAGGQPSDKTHILVSYVYKAVFNLYRYGYGAALSMIIFVLLLGFSLAFLNKTKATDAVV